MVATYVLELEHSLHMFQNSTKMAWITKDELVNTAGLLLLKNNEAKTNFIYRLNSCNGFKLFVTVSSKRQRFRNRKCH